VGRPSAEFEYDWPFLGPSLDMVLGASHTLYIWTTTLVAVLYCASWYVIHWQADAVLAVLPRMGDERKPAEVVDVPSKFAPWPRVIVMAC